MAASITNNGYKSDKLITDAIRVALKREAVGADGKPTRKLNVIAEKLVDEAAAGNMTAIKEVMDRTEGRPNQSVSIEPGESLLAILDELEQRRDLREIEGEVIDADPQPNGGSSADAMLIEHDGDTTAQ